MATVDPHVFRAYDIRGKAHTSISVEFCELVGRGFGEELKERYEIDNPSVIVGRDARTHSEELEKALVDGLVSVGCNVKLIGQTPSPVNYFALCHFEADGSVQVTASHNAAEDNGLKLQVRSAEAFAGDDIQKLRTRIEKNGFANKDRGLRIANREEVDAMAPYVEKVASIVSLRGALRQAQGKFNPRHNRIVIDFGNGVAGPVYMEAFQKAGIDVIPLFEDPDGTFPNHIADPSKHDTLKTLIETVKKEKVDCGLAFDGDGDRVGFVDEEGNIVSPDYILLLLAEDHLSRNPEATIIYTVSMSSILQTEIEKLGGKSIMCEVGHSFVEHTMRKNGSHLGGEQSGHFFCGEDYYDYDDALVAALRTLSIFGSSAPSSFSSLFDHFPKIYQSPEWRPTCPDDKKTEIVQKITKHFEKDYPCVTIDGVRIDFGDGAWAGIRQSNTSPKISVCVEARSEEKLAEVEKIVRDRVDGTLGHLGL